MKPIERIVQNYKEKSSRFWTGTFKEPAIPAMQDAYEAQMSSLRDKQLLAIDIMNSEGVPVARRSTFLMWTNYLWKLTESFDCGGPAAIKDALGMEAWLTIQFGWNVTEVTTADKIAENVFSIVLPHEPA
jgi:hypothetical protein